MTIPLLKVPLLLLEAYCARISVKSPTPRSPTNERAQYSKDAKTRDIVPVPNVLAPLIYRYNFYSIVVIEGLVIVASLIAPWTQVPRIFHPTTSLDAHKLYPSLFYSIGLIFMCAGSIIRAACYRHMGRFFTFELSLKQGHQLVTSGPYAIVRHPSYVGSCLFYSGACLSQLGSGSWLAESGLWESAIGIILGSTYIGYSIFICFFLLSRVPKEDMMMKKEFQGQWVEYAKQTPYRLIPYIY